jgi:tRNA modification GTPase
VGIVRLSGPDAFAIADRVTRGRIPAGRQPTHTLRRVHIVDPGTGEEIDDGLRAIFRSPHTFTGEQVVEIQGHGGGVNLTRVFAACLAAGARAAKPGELSERAFANGRMDLAQAEAVAALVSAGTVEAQRAARRQLGGELSRAVREAGDHIKASLARIEASIDFPEDVGEVDAEAVTASLAAARSVIDRLLGTAAYGRRLREGVTVALVGRPNVGKSSLLNALSGTDRAIVTPIPGTTRDVVEEALNLHGIPVRALDTAGLRETTDPVEQIGVERARRAASDADVIIAVLDATSGSLTPDDHALLETLSGRNAVVAVNKADAADASPITESARAAAFGAPVVAVSARHGSGLDHLAATMAAVLGARKDEGADAPLVTSARHEDALRRASAALGQAIGTLTVALPAELVAVDAHGALQALGEITGETAREEIIAGIFATFCIGK